MTTRAKASRGCGFEIGDKVVVMQSYNSLFGQMGIVKAILDTAHIGVDFGVHFPSITHCLNGHLQENTGYWLSPSDIEKVPENSSEEEEAEAIFKRALKTIDSYIIMNGEVAKLNFQKLAEPDVLINRMRNDMIEKFRAHVRALDQAKDAYKTAKESITLLLDLSIEKLAEGWRVGKNGDTITYFIPITLEPKYLCKEGLMRELSPEMKEETKRENLFWCVSIRKNRYHHSVIRDARFVRVHHYHSMSDTDCLGTWVPPESITTADQLAMARDEVQTLLETINYDSLGGTLDPTFPSTSKIWRTSTLPSSPLEWDSREFHGGFKTNGWCRFVRPRSFAKVGDIARVLLVIEESMGEYSIVGEFEEDRECSSSYSPGNKGFIVPIDVVEPITASEAEAIKRKKSRPSSEGSLKDSKPKIVATGGGVWSVE